MKMNATEELQYIDSYEKVDQVLERVAAIRESCGKYFGIAVDFHGRVHRPMAKVLAKKLEEFDPMFLEEPVLCEHMELFKEIADCATSPSPPASACSQNMISSACLPAEEWILSSPTFPTRAESPR